VRSGNESIEVTSEYPEYLKWRISILRQIKKDSPDKCGSNIETVINHIEQYLQR
jgi:hypothetical protein